MKCLDCNIEAIWTENKVIYGKNYGRSYMCWYCPKCFSYVGCHNNTQKPLGTLANKETRLWRMKAHEVVDVLWKSGKWSRRGIYKYMSKKFGREMHIGESGIDDCKKIIELVLTLNP